LGINLHAGETLRSEGEAGLLEIQRERGRSGGWVGANVRILKGVTLRLGTFDSHQSVLPTKTVPVDNGRLYQTDQRIVFLGTTTEVEIQTKDIISTDESGGHLTVYVHGRATPYVFAPTTPVRSLTDREYSAPVSRLRDGAARILEERARGWEDLYFAASMRLEDEELARLQAADTPRIRRRSELADRGRLLNAGPR
jgi:hypothetical protein